MDVLRYPHAGRLTHRGGAWGLAIGAGLALLGTATTLTSSVSATPTTPAAGSGPVVAVGAENQYADVISQIGGRYVKVSAILDNPNADPHSFESSPRVASLVSSAGIVVQNGLGYDAFMNKIEQATPSRSRKVIDVQALLGLPSSTDNPHLWYKPTTMPAVAKALASDLSRMEPAHASYFDANLSRFDKSLRPWYRAIANFKARFPHTPVATTEPVGDYLLEAMGTADLTPVVLQADIMNGVDPAPQAVTMQSGLFSGHRVKIFVYNQQVTDSLTQTFLSQAKRAGIAVVGVYETMPTPGYHYQTWMLAETRALQLAVTESRSSERLP